MSIVLMSVYVCDVCVHVPVAAVWVAGLEAVDSHSCRWTHKLLGIVCSCAVHRFSHFEGSDRKRMAVVLSNPPQTAYTGELHTHTHNACNIYNRTAQEVCNFTCTRHKTC